MKRMFLTALVAVATMASMAVERGEKIALARELAANGIVLLENKDGALPLKAGEEVVLAGVTSYFNIRMGWGSGDMMNNPCVQYDKGLENAGIVLDADFAKLYRDFIVDPKRQAEVYTRINLDWSKWTRRFDEPDVYGDKFIELAKGKRTKKCIVTIGRGAGESEDLQEAPGGYRLHGQEEQLLKAACESFDTVIVLLNVPGVIDTSFMDVYPIKALVFTSYLGEVAGDAVADVLTGKVCPSGKTVDTWAKRYCYYPTTDCFGTMEIPYKEDIFVGYRHFDCCCCPEGMVRYPFGYGLSYTMFEVTGGAPQFIDGKVALSVTVANGGKVAGAEVIQAYVALPTSDELRTPVKKLCAFAKTRVLKPGESEQLDLSFDLDEQASFSEQEAAWMLPRGEYSIYVGNSSAEIVKAGSFEFEDAKIVQKVKNRFSGNPDANAVERKPLVKKAKGFVKLQDVVAGKATLEDLVAQFTDEELAAMMNGRIFDGEGYAAEGATGVGGVKKGVVDCEAGEFWSSEKYGIPAITTADGPSGVRLGNFNDPITNYNRICSTMVAWPCGTALAQGWDVKAAERFGRMVADDMALSGIDGWLAPGVNIHRNPLCGRNFEYFSEDPYLAGLLGAGVVRGVQTTEDGKSSGRFATVKHFCTNNEEFHRDAENNIVSEQALREIYLKPFELAVKYGKPHAIMSSYNKLNGEYCATTYDLMTGVLREEWGFDGVVMTDWWNAADKMRHAAAGNDVVMPGVRKEYNAMLAAIKDGRLKRADAQRAVVNVLKPAVIKLSK